jgi:hypothetical protein
VKQFAGAKSAQESVATINIFAEIILDIKSCLLFKKNPALF